MTITFWNGWSGGDGLKIVTDMVAEFSKAHENIDAKNVTVDWPDFYTKLPLALKAGKGPDIAVAHGDDIATFAAQGLTLKCDDMVNSLGYTEQDFPTGLLADGKYNGAQYAIPWSVTPLGTYANKKVLKSAGLESSALPIDETGHEKFMKALKAKGVPGNWMGVDDNTLRIFETLLWQFDGNLYNQDVSKATFNSSAGVQALTWMTDQIRNGYSPRNVGSGAWNALIAGKSAIEWNGVWMNSDPALKKVDYAVAPVPQIGSKQAVWSSSTHWIFTHNSSQDKNKTAAAVEFVRWMNDNSLQWTAVELPAKNSVRDDPKVLKKYPYLRPFIAELDYAHYEVTAPGITSVNPIIFTELSNAIQGKKSPKQALDDAASKANQQLAENRSQYGG